MASYGAAYLKFAPTQGDEPADALPKYGAAVQLGELVKLTDNPTMANAKLYGDNRAVEDLSSFVSAAIEMESTELDDETNGVLFGSKVTEGQVSYNAADNAPYGGLAFFANRIRHNKPYVLGVFYPKVKATLGGSEYNTKGETITLATDKATMTAFAPNVGDWKITKRFDTEEEAKAWVDAQLAPTTQAGV